jgi:hypothetical protein
VRFNVTASCWAGQNTDVWRWSTASEDDGLAAVSDDAVLAVQEHGTGQRGAFDVGAEAGQICNDILLDIGPSSRSSVT